jgi:hypothetical protein
LVRDCANHNDPKYFLLQSERGLLMYSGP